MKLGTLNLMTATIAALLVSALAGSGASAADKTQLQARFERRYPQLLEYKSQGKIGETTEGTVEAVDPKYLEDEAIKSLLDEENADRRELYQIIAREENTTPAKVAERTARRNFQKARPGEYLKAADGTWRKKT
ncbi:MAG TPA: YdbL family protein [Tepidisphaeraceae bacterium]|nr:YdbL family protein [Tepidisphaeraceae bacterium]